MRLHPSNVRRSVALYRDGVLIREICECLSVIKNSGS